MGVLTLSVGPGRQPFLLRFPGFFQPTRHLRDDDLPRARLWRLDIRFIWFFAHFASIAFTRESLLAQAAA
jgi:hypothetical protein